MADIAIVGAGQVGATLAFLILGRNLGNVILIDVVEGLAKGKALDMMQAGSILGFENSVVGTDDYSKMEGAKIVVVTAGFPRKPGMTRLDLLKKNSEVVGSVVDEITRYAPQSIIIMVTNPLDVLTYLALKRSGFSWKKVLGQAGILDSARFKYFIAKEWKCSSSDILTLVLGGHSETMVPLVSQTKVSGRSLGSILPEEKIHELVEKTRDGGTEIVSLLKSGGAYYAPSASVLAMVRAIVRDTDEVFPCSVYLDGQYGLSDVCVGVPVRLGKEGVKEIVEIELTDGEKAALHKSAQIYKDTIKEIIAGT